MEGIFNRKDKSMNELKVFQNSEFGELGVLIIDGKEFLPASQCAKILGYTNPRDAIKRHCKSEGVVKHDGVSYTTNQHGVTSQQITEIKYISEGNLYRLIIRSKLPSAEKFERWVFDEVLLELRKNGSYGNNFNLEEVIAKNCNGGCFRSYETNYAGSKSRNHKRMRRTGTIWKKAFAWNF